MNYVIESLLSGIYTWFIYMIFSYFISPFTKNLYVLLLVVGFSKHFLGSSLQIHNWYCNNGEACLKELNQDNRPLTIKKYKSSNLHLLRDSLLEAIAFLCLGVILHLCAFKMRMATLLFADETAPEWAFSKRKGVRLFVQTNSILFFSLGVILHIVAEKLLVHKYFCKTICAIEESN